MKFISFMFKRFISRFSGFLIVCASLGYPLSAANLLSNPGFESGRTGWSGYYNGYVIETSGNAHSGSSALQCANGSSVKTFGARQSLYFSTALPAGYYRASGWARAENSAVNWLENGKDFDIYLDIKLADGSWLYGQRANFWPGTHGWEYAEVIVQAAQPIKQVDYFVLHRQATGTVWFDDLVFEQIDIDLDGGGRGYALWTRDSMTRVLPTDPHVLSAGTTPEEPETAITLARGEAESFQVLLYADYTPASPDALDTYESYADDAALQQAYQIQGALSAVNLDGGAYAGAQAMRGTVNYTAPVTMLFDTFDTAMDLTKWDISVTHDAAITAENSMARLLAPSASSGDAVMSSHKTFSLSMPRNVDIRCRWDKWNSGGGSWQDRGYVMLKNAATGEPHWLIYSSFNRGDDSAPLSVMVRSGWQLTAQTTSPVLIATAAWFRLKIAVQTTSCTVSLYDAADNFITQWTNSYDALADMQVCCGAGNNGYYPATAMDVDRLVVHSTPIAPQLAAVEHPQAAPTDFSGMQLIQFQFKGHEAFADHGIEASFFLRDVTGQELYCYLPDCLAALAWTSCKLFLADFQESPDDGDTIAATDRTQIAAWGLRLQQNRADPLSASFLIDQVETSVDTRLPVDVSVGNLVSSTGEILPASAIQWFQVGYIYVDQFSASYHPDVVSRQPGWWPDALLPVSRVHLLPDFTQSVWFTVRAPSGRTAGTYRGTCRLQPQGLPAGDVKVTVTVYDFALSPGAGHFKNTFALMDGYMEQIYGKPLSSTLRRNYGRYLLEHRLNPDDISRTDLPDLSDLLYYRSLGMNCFNVRNLVEPRGTLPWRCTSPSSWFTETNKQQLIAELDAYFDQLSQYPSLKACAYIHGFDEQSVEEYGAIISDWFGTVQDRWQVPTLTTAKLHHDAAEMQNLNVSWMCPILHDASYFDEWRYKMLPAETVRQTSEDLQVWGYTCISSAYPMANCEATNWLIEPRIMGWQFFHEKMDGFLYWGLNIGWGDGPNTAIRPDHEAPLLAWSIAAGAAYPGIYGDGRLLYAGVEGPIGSIRLENLRDGLEDYEYLWMLAQALGDNEAVRAQCQGVVASLEHFTRNPQTLYDYREAIARQLEPYFLAEDINRDGRIDLQDFALLAAQWQQCNNPVRSECP